MEKFTPYPKPDKFLGKKKSETESELMPTYSTGKPDNFISQGYVGSVSSHEFKDENDQLIHAVKKEQGANILTSDKEIEQQQRIQQLLVAVGIPTFDWLLRDKENSLYSPNLNTGDHVALSSNNPMPVNSGLRLPLDVSPEVVESIETQLERISRVAGRAGLVIDEDAYFFVYNKKTKTINVIVGDLDNIREFSSDNDSAPDVLEINNAQNQGFAQSSFKEFKKEYLFDTV